MAGDVELNDLLESCVNVACLKTLLLPHSGLLKNKDAIGMTSRGSGVCG